jgi:hypothetical protein
VTRAAAAALALATGCATIIAGGPDHVPVNTNPPGAYVYVNGQVVGQTPTVISLDRHDSSAQIQIYLPGFQPIVLVRDKSLNAWTLLNLLVGVLPIIVDLVTGDIQEYDDTPLALGLTPAGPGTTPTPPPPPYPPALAPAPPPPTR